ncbi:MAG TPA: transcriptional regulator [Aliidongia sp.]|uniref:transcriptional regulator n=1 Tax=Aliidongia sp. TaxID=1914230 RepID=UPI002DDC9FBE|nr:transcriptional regulator [Aliidongia sp.]HEV2675518.1 transcriptional regulator [Aliidongia sp.]
MTEPTWLLMLRKAVGRLGSIQAVADDLGYSRTAISLVLSGKYDKPTRAIEQAVLARLDYVECPHLSSEISREECNGYSRRRMPQSDPAKIKHWSACQRCPVMAAALGVERKAS